MDALFFNNQTESANLYLSTWIIKPDGHFWIGTYSFYALYFFVISFILFYFSFNRITAFPNDFMNFESNF